MCALQVQRLYLCWWIISAATAEIKICFYGFFGLTKSGIIIKISSVTYSSNQMCTISFVLWYYLLETYIHKPPTPGREKHTIKIEMYEKIVWGKKWIAFGSFVGVVLGALSIYSILIHSDVIKQRMGNIIIIIIYISVHSVFISFHSHTRITYPYISS